MLFAEKIPPSFMHVFSSAVHLVAAAANTVAELLANTAAKTRSAVASTILLAKDKAPRSLVSKLELAQ